MSHVEHIGPATLYLGDAYEIRPTLGWFDHDVTDPQYEFDNSGGGEFRQARGASEKRRHRPMAKTSLWRLHCGQRAITDCVIEYRKSPSKMLCASGVPGGKSGPKVALSPAFHVHQPCKGQRIVHWHESTSHRVFTLTRTLEAFHAIHRSCDTDCRKIRGAQT